MLIAMGATAFLCVFIGVFPNTLYALLPYEVEYHPYTKAHVVGQLQLLCFALLAFGVLMRTGIHPPEIKAINLDTDWTYRKFTPSVLVLAARGLGGVWASLASVFQNLLSGILAMLYQVYGPKGRRAQSSTTGSMVLWIAIFLGITLIVNFVS